MSSFIFRLPIDVMVEIIALLTPQEFLQLALTCKFMNVWFSSDDVWRSLLRAHWRHTQDDLGLELLSRKSGYAVAKLAWKDYAKSIDGCYVSEVSHHECTISMY